MSADEVREACTAAGISQEALFELRRSCSLNVNQLRTLAAHLSSKYNIPYANQVLKASWVALVQSMLFDVHAGHHTLYTSPSSLAHSASSIAPAVSSPLARKQTAASAPPRTPTAATIATGIANNTTPFRNPLHSRIGVVNSPLSPSRRSGGGGGGGGGRCLRPASVAVGRSRDWVPSAEHLADVLSLIRKLRPQIDPFCDFVTYVHSQTVVTSAAAAGSGLKQHFFVTKPLLQALSVEEGDEEEDMGGEAEGGGGGGGGFGGGGALGGGGTMIRGGMGTLGSDRPALRSRLRRRHCVLFLSVVAHVQVFARVYGRDGVHQLRPSELGGFDLTDVLEAEALDDRQSAAATEFGTKLVLAMKLDPRLGNLGGVGGSGGKLVSVVMVLDRLDPLERVAKLYERTLQQALMRRVAEDDDDVAENHRPSHPFGDLTLRHRRDLSALRARTLCECPAPPVWTAGRSAADGGGKGRESGGGTTVSLRQGHRRARMSDVEMADMKLSFACPLLLRRVVHPARGRLCRHLQAVGAEGLLEMYAFKPSVRCTVCNVEIATDELIIDAQFLRLLQKYRGQDGCMVSPDGSDRPLPDASRTPPSGSRKRPLSSCREVDDDVVDDDDDDNEDRLGRYHRHLGDSDDDNQGCEREAAVGGGGGGGGGGSGSGIEKMLDVVLVLDDDDDGDGDCAMRDA